MGTRRWELQIGNINSELGNQHTEPWTWKQHSDMQNPGEPWTHRTLNPEATLWHAGGSSTPALGLAFRVT